MPNLAGMNEIDRILAAARALAEAAADISARAWRGALAVGYKPDGSSLTEADLSIEAMWRESIRRQFPSHGILGEEYGVDPGSSAWTWVLDPIDGTRQFAAGLLNFASLIGVCRDGVPVLGFIDLPAPGARYVAAEGRGTRFGTRLVRSSGRRALDEAVVSLANPDSFTAPDSAAGYRRLRTAGRARVFDGGAAAYGALARGLVDLCLNGDDLDACDICALCPVVQEAGGVISDWQGRPLTLRSSGAILASASPELHAAALDRLALPG
nr:inositol monophosphatase family protein [Paracoccus binzhouensis]